jgi:hypothetical protein
MAGGVRAKIARGGEPLTHALQPKRGGRDARGPHPSRDQLSASPAAGAWSPFSCSPLPAFSYSYSYSNRPLPPPSSEPHEAGGTPAVPGGARTAGGAARSAGVDRRHLACPPPAVRWRPVFRPRPHEVVNSSRTRSNPDKAGETPAVHTHRANNPPVTRSAGVSTSLGGGRRSVGVRDPAAPWTACISLAPPRCPLTPGDHLRQAR